MGKKKAESPTAKSTALTSWLATPSKPASRKRSETPASRRRSISVKPKIVNLDAPGPSKPAQPEVVDLDGDEDDEALQWLGDTELGGDERLEQNEPVRVVNGEIIVLDDSDDEDVVTSCPVCDESLGALDSQAAASHVDRCVKLGSKRKQSVTPVAGPSTDNKKLRPISSFRYDAPARAKTEDADETFDVDGTGLGGSGFGEDEEMDDEPELELCGSHAKKGKGKAKASDGKPNAFTALMVGHAEDKQWKAAAKDYWSTKGKRGVKRTPPFYKILDGMPIAVDAFCYGKVPNVEAYFLSHAHSDHYTALSGSWEHGPIYCSKTTANLIVSKLGVHKKWVKPLEEDKPYTIAGVTVTVMDANHCPGSSIFLFEGRQTTTGSPYARSNRIFRYLHTGDFRASPRHLENPALKGKTLDIIYLDTTYCNPRYQFPAQDQVLDACAELIKSRVEGDTSALRRGMGGDGSRERSEAALKGWLAGAKKEEPDADAALLAAKTEESEKKERILILCGMYSIGKERIVKAIARALGSKIYATEAKQKIFACIEDPELHSMLTTNPLEADVHCTNLFAIQQETLANYLDSYNGAFTKIIGLRPTGWTFKPQGQEDKAPTVGKIIANAQRRDFSPAFLYPQRDSTKRCEAYGVPYSEHSSFLELTCFCVSTPHVRIIPTVNVHNESSRNKMKGWFEKWQFERKKRREAGEPDLVPPRSPSYW